ncbi:MAG: hypothetical protein AAGE65_05880 [Planctomycetota bacterium]
MAKEKRFRMPDSTAMDRLLSRPRFPALLAKHPELQEEIVKNLELVIGAFEATIKSDYRIRSHNGSLGSRNSLRTRVTTLRKYRNDLAQVKQGVADDDLFRNRILLQFHTNVVGYFVMRDIHDDDQHLAEVFYDLDAMYTLRQRPLTRAMYFAGLVFGRGVRVESYNDTCMQIYRDLLLIEAATEGKWARRAATLPVAARAAADWCRTAWMLLPRAARWALGGLAIARSGVM